MPKKIREISQWDGYTKSTNELIKRFLGVNGEKMFGEIRAYLEENGLPYSKKGLHLRLNKLIAQGTLIRTDSSDKPYPVYKIKIQKNNLAETGWWLRYCMEKYLYENLFLEITDDNKRRGLMTTLIGVYSIFNEIQSWKLISEGKSYDENFERRASYLRNALPLSPFTCRSEMDNQKSPLPEPPGMYTDKNYQRKVLGFEKILEKAFPLEMKICKRAWNTTSEIVKITSGK